MVAGVLRVADAMVQKVVHVSLVRSREARRVAATVEAVFEIGSGGGPVHQITCVGTL